MKLEIFKCLYISQKKKTGAKNRTEARTPGIICTQLKFILTNLRNRSRIIQSSKIPLEVF